MSYEPTAATYFMRPLSRALRARGLTIERADSGRATYAQAVEIWNDAVARSGCAEIGLEAAKQREVGDYGALEYATRTSASLRAAFERISRYHRLLNDRARVELFDEGDLTRIRYVPPSADMPRAYLEFVLATWSLTARELSGVQQPIHAVSLPHEAPADAALYREMFGPSVHFAARDAELQLARCVCDAALARSDAALAKLLDRHVEALLSELSTRGSITRAASHAIERRLSDGPPRLECVAADMQLAPRALRARLQQEGASFSEVVDETRRRLAATMVEDASLSLGEIAFRLGFSETSAFHRAYRRWTGRTPRARR
jgi:AraC-like DNA-binding protein